MLRHRVPIVLALIGAACISTAWVPRPRNVTTMAALSAAGSSGGWSNAFSVDFDGTNDYVTIGQPADMSGTLPNPITISAWFKQSDLVAQHYVFSRSRPFAPVITFALATNTDGTAFTYMGAVTSTTSGGSLSTVWRHLAATRGSAGKLYVDGVQVGSNINTIGSNNATVDWLIGASRNLADNSDATLFALGNIDEVTVWNAELSGAEITELYHGGKPANPGGHSKSANLIHYWPMGDGDTFPTLFDQVGTADGTMTSMASNDIEADVP